MLDGFKEGEPPKEFDFEQHELQEQKLSDDEDLGCPLGMYDGYGLEPEPEPDAASFADDPTPDELNLPIASTPPEEDPPELVPETPPVPSTPPGEASATIDELPSPAADSRDLPPPPPIDGPLPPSGGEAGDWSGLPPETADALFDEQIGAPPRPEERARTREAAAAAMDLTAPELIEVVDSLGRATPIERPMTPEEGRAAAEEQLAQGFTENLREVERLSVKVATLSDNAARDVGRGVCHTSSFVQWCRPEEEVDHIGRFQVNTSGGQLHVAAIPGQETPDDRWSYHQLPDGEARFIADDLSERRRMRVKGESVEINQDIMHIVRPEDARYLTTLSRMLEHHGALLVGAAVTAGVSSEQLDAVRSDDPYAALSEVDALVANVVHARALPARLMDDLTHSINMLRERIKPQTTHNTQLQKDEQGGLAAVAKRLLGYYDAFG